MNKTTCRLERLESVVLISGSRRYSWKFPYLAPSINIYSWAAILALFVRDPRFNVSFKFGMAGLLINDMVPMA